MCQDSVVWEERKKERERESVGAEIEFEVSFIKWLSMAHRAHWGAISMQIQYETNSFSVFPKRLLLVVSFFFLAFICYKNQINLQLIVMEKVKWNIQTGSR